MIKKINYILKKLSIIFFSLGIILGIFAIYNHPLVGDDYYLKFQINQSSSFYNFFLERYFNWTGRLLQIFLSYFIYSNEFNHAIIKLLIIPIVGMNIYLIIFKIVGKLKTSYTDYIIFFILTWFIYPSIAETIFWTAGFITYLIPLFFLLLYLSFFFRNEKNIKKNIFFYTIALIASFLAGSAHEQLFAGGFIISSWQIFNFYQKDKNKIKFLLPIYFMFVLGGLFLFLSPGNFNRIDALGSANFLSTLYKSLIFIFSSLFYLGDVHASLILYLIVFILFICFNKKVNYKAFSSNSNILWVTAFFISLFIVIPAINAASERLLFFPIVFLYIFFLKIIFFNNQFTNVIYKNYKNIFCVILCLIFVLDCFLGSITNYYYNKENNKRFLSIEKFLLKKEDSFLKISHYTIVPSRLTFIQTPAHDSKFLENISKEYKIKIKYLETYPRSFNIKKEIKFLFQ
jgi:hypothetical protein